MNLKNLQASTPTDQKVEKIGALDELFRATLAYRRSQAYLDLMKFISRFPKVRTL